MSGWTQSDIDKLHADRTTGMIAEQISEAKQQVRSKHGKRADLNNKAFRSAWEANIARYLNWLQGMGAVLRWEYETEEFWFPNIQRGTRSYKIDFKIWFAKEPDQPVYWEVKGWLDATSKTKLKRMQKYFPEIRLELIDARQYRAIAQQCIGVILHWESKGDLNP